MPLVRERPRALHQETWPSREYRLSGTNEQSSTNELASDELRNFSILPRRYDYDDGTRLTTLRSGLGSATFDEVISNVRHAFHEAQGEEFEYGMDSEFAQALEDIFVRYPEYATDALDEVIRTWTNDVEIQIEAIHQIGIIEHAPSEFGRSVALSKYLRHPNPDFRYVAALGFASIAGSLAVRKLRDAINAETSEDLKQSLVQILDQLE